MRCEEAASSPASSAQAASRRKRRPHAADNGTSGTGTSGTRRVFSVVSAVASLVFLSSLPVPSSSSTLLLAALLLLPPTAVVFVAAKNADYYKLLGISRDATHKEIKKAYRAKSLEFHPDKNKDEDASEKFAEINRAYEVLSDEDLKNVYDRHGEEGLKQHERQGGGGGGGGFDDIFSHFFHGGGGGRRQQQERQTPSVELPLSLTLEQLYAGITLEVDYERQVLCLNWEMCTKSAPDCQAPGIRVRRQQLAPGFVQQFQTQDERCVAAGKAWQADCSACPTKTVTETIGLTVEVPPGYRENEHISFDGVADELPGHTPGDLHFRILQEPHEDYHRDKDDLYKTIEIPLVDALTGFSITLKHLDGVKYDVNVDDVTECDQVLRVPGKGMPRRNGRGHGDLYITFEVDFPEKLNEEQKKKIRDVLEEVERMESGEGGGDEL